MQTVKVIADHEIERETGSRVVLLMPVSVRSLYGAKPIRCALGRLRCGLARSDVA